MHVPTRWSPDDDVTFLEWTAKPLLWTGEADTGDLQDAGYYWGAAVQELVAAPALDSSDGAEGAAQLYRQLAGRIVRSLRAWENSGCLELRYVWGHHQHGGDRLRVVLIARAVGRELDEARAWAGEMLQNATALLPTGHAFASLQAPMPRGIDAWAEIERVEEVRQPGPFVPSETTAYYYLLHPMGGGGSAWPSLPRLLASAKQPGFFSILLMPTTMTDVERAAVDHISTLARHLSEPQQDYDFFGNQTVIPADAAAHDVHLAWQRFPGRHGVLARLGVAAAASDLARMTSAMGSIIVENGHPPANELATRFKVVTDIDPQDARLTAALGLVFPRLSHPVWALPDEEAPLSVQRMRYFFTEEEAGGLLVLPIPDEQGVPGMARARRADNLRETVSHEEATPEGITVGQVLHHGQPTNPTAIPLTAINRHTLIVGAPGSGKTTTVHSILSRLWREHRIPFMAIEPTKQEYRSLLEVPGLDELRVISLGRDDIAPLRLNPLAPPAGVRREVHANAVLNTLKLALPLFPPLPQLVEEALERVYTLADWDYDTTSEAGIAPPTLRGLLDAFEPLFDELGYSGDARNIGVALKVRLGSLLRGARGRVLDTVESVDFDELMGRPVVVELDEIADNNEKALLAAILLDRIRSAARARGSADGKLRHVTVIEEAHRLLGGAAQATRDATDGDNTRAETVNAFCDAIAELRSVGEGFILCSQSPSQLAHAAVANTAVRILHRIESAADREVILADLDASQLSREVAARLGRGEAIARWPGQDDGQLIRMEPADGVDTGRPTSNELVATRMAPHTEQVRSLLPYTLCTREMCPAGCQPAVRASGQRVATAVGGAAKEQWDKVRGSAHALDPITQLLMDDAGDTQFAYCGAVHLSVARKAFYGRLPTVVRPLLIDALRRVADET